MSLKICTAEFMFSQTSGTGFSESWLPRMVAERMATSGKDGEVGRTPDAVPFIDTDMLWTNTTAEPQHLQMSIHRASRTLVTSNPNTLALDDVWAFDIGASPRAPTPTGTGSGFASRFKINRSVAASAQFGRLFRDVPDTVGYVEVGAIDPGDTLHFRYRALFSTPGEWRSAHTPRHEMNARWARLRLWAAPWLEGSI